MNPIIAGIVGFIALFFLVLKFDIRKMLYFDIVIDIAGTSLLMVLFAGTYAGMTAALIGGALLSIALFFLKKVIGYKKPTMNGWKMVANEAWGYESYETRRTNHSTNKPD